MSYATYIWFHLIALFKILNRVSTLKVFYSISAHMELELYYTFDKSNKSWA